MWSTQLYQVHDVNVNENDNLGIGAHDAYGNPASLSEGDNLFLNYVYGHTHSQFQHNLSKLDDDMSGTTSRSLYRSIDKPV